MMQVRELSFSYTSSKKKILDGINFSIMKGCCMAILGNNGSGKSTLLKCLTGINAADHGQVIEDGKNILKMDRRDIAKKIAYLPQHYILDETMVFDAVLLGRKPYIRWNADQNDIDIVKKLIEKLDLQKLSTKPLNRISGGELQKVFLARALAQEPDYLFLDEPTSNLDPKNQHEILSLIRDIALKQKIGIVVVIHDLNLAARYCDRFLFLRDSGIFAQGDIELVTSETIKAVYNIDTEIIEHEGRKVIIPC